MLVRVCLAALSLVVCAAPAAAAPAPAASSSKLTISRPVTPTVNGRLPVSVRPVKQELALTLDPSKERYQGSVAIDVDVAGPQTVIHLHARGLTVDEATVSQLSPTGATAQPARFAVVDEVDGVASLTLARAVMGKVTIRMRFSAPFHTDLDALYRVSVGGDWYAFSQFEALAAREAFPCFDEPGFKIPFHITITHPTAVKAIGNTQPANTVDNKDGTTTTKLRPTQPLPTYLLAFVVGPVDVVDGGVIAPAFDRQAPLPVRAIAVKGQGARTTRALADTKLVLSALERMFEIGYAYDKLDIVAVPDFAAGAMENAGLVTFRDAALFLDDNSDIARLKGSLEVIAHELAHQWFGNLVTMAWWDDLWLNEGFATWCAARIVQQVRPSYDGDFGLREGANWVMGEDSLVTARRIRNPIQNRGDIDNAFDGITYSKGAAVLAMFEEYIDRQKGKGTFLSGVRAYLKDKRFGSGTTADFLRAIGVAAGFDVDAAFSTFLDQPGVPFVSARCEPAADQTGKARIVAESSRFLPIGSSGERNVKWDIPFCVSFQHDESHPRPGVKREPSSRNGDGNGNGNSNSNSNTQVLCALLAGGAGAVTLPASTCPKVWHPNADGAGYYRFSLPGADLVALSKALPAQTPGERLSFASTLRAGFNAGTVSFKDSLAAATPLIGDAESSVARTPVGFLQFARDDVFAPAAPERVAVNRRAALLVQPALNKLGLVARAADTPRDKERRAFLFAVAVDVDGAPRAIAIAAGKELWQKGTTKKLAPDLWGTAYAAAVEDDADVAAFDARLAQVKKEIDPRRRGEMLAALAGTRVLRDRALRLVFDGELRTSELLAGLWGQGHDPAGAAGAFAFLKENHDAIAQKIPEDWRAGLPNVVDGCSEDVAVAVDAFFRPKVASTPGMDLALAQALEEIRLCAAKRAAHEASVRAVFPAR